MTYNVFGGTLSLAQSIKLCHTFILQCTSFKSVMCFGCIITVLLAHFTSSGLAMLQYYSASESEKLNIRSCI